MCYLLKVVKFLSTAEEFTVAFARVEMLQYFGVVVFMVRNRPDCLCCFVYQC